MVVNRVKVGNNGINYRAVLMVLTILRE